MRTMKLRTCALLSVFVGAGCGGETGSAGASGEDAVVAVDTATAEQCADGGIVVRTGRDANGDGELQESEVRDETVLCDPAAGEPGPTGEPGADADPGNDAECFGRDPVEVTSAGIVEDGDYFSGTPYTLRVEASGSDLEFAVLGSDVSVAGPFAAAGSSAYEEEITFEAMGPRSIAVVAYDGCTLDVAQVPLHVLEGPVVLATGYASACAIVRPPGPLNCWGDPDLMDLAPVEEDFVQVALSKVVNNRHGCGLRVDGSLVCWGTDVDGSVDDANAAAGPFREVAVQHSVTCGVLESDGTLECWGYEDWYGNADALAHEGPLSSLAMAPEYWQRTCAIETASQEVACWDSGLDYYGAVSGPNGSTATYRKVVVDGITTCGLQLGGQVDCWGAYDDLDGASARDVGALEYGVCIVREEGTLACEAPASIVTDELPLGGGFHQVDGGSSFACAVHETGKIRCWGSDGYGQVDVPLELALLP